MKLLNSRKIAFEKNDISTLGYDTIRTIHILKNTKFIPKSSNHKTVPIVFGDKGEFIGGYSELEKFLSK
jgi:hypothetical protein